MTLINNLIFQRRISKIYTLYKHEVLPSLNCYNKSYLLNINNVHKCHFSIKKIRSSSMLKNQRLLMTLGFGLGVGAITSGIYMYNRPTFKTVSSSIVTTTIDEEYFLQETPPTHTVARSIYNSSDRSGFKITLYQFQTCPFCCKVRAFLDYYGFSYDVVEVNSVTRKQMKWTTYQKVPFIVIEQEGIQTVMQLKDSSMIISALMSFIINKSKPLEEIVEGSPVTYVNEDGKRKPKITNQYFLFYGEEPSGKSDQDIVQEIGKNILKPGNVC